METIFAIVAMGKTNSKEFNLTIMHLGNNFKNWNPPRFGIWIVDARQVSFLCWGKGSAEKNAGSKKKRHPKTEQGNQHSSFLFSSTVGRWIPLGASSLFAWIFLNNGDWLDGMWHWRRRCWHGFLCGSSKAKKWKFWKMFLKRWKVKRVSHRGLTKEKVCTKSLPLKALSIFVAIDKLKCVACEYFR